MSCCLKPRICQASSRTVGTLASNKNYPIFPSSNWTWNERSPLNEFLESFLCFVGKKITFTFTITFTPKVDRLDISVVPIVVIFKQAASFQRSKVSKFTLICTYFIGVCPRNFSSRCINCDWFSEFSSKADPSVTDLGLGSVLADVSVSSWSDIWSSTNTLKKWRTKCMTRCCH